MAYKVFISHNMNDEDTALIQRASDQAKAAGIEFYIAEQDKKPGEPLSGKIEEAVKRCDCLVAFWTKGGARSSFVSQEIGVAVGLRKPTLIVVEEGVPIEGFLVGRETIKLDRQNAWKAIGDLNASLAAKHAKKQFGTGIVIAASLAALLCILCMK